MGTYLFGSGSQVVVKFKVLVYLYWKLVPGAAKKVRYHSLLVDV